MEQPPSEPSPEELITGTYLNRAFNKLRTVEGEQIDREATDKINQILIDLQESRKENPQATDKAIEDAAKQYKEFGINKELITLWVDLPELEQWNEEKEGEFVVSDERSAQIKSNIRELLGIPKAFTIKLITSKNNSALFPQTFQNENIARGPLMGAFIVVQISKHNKPLRHIKYAINEKTVDILDANFKTEIRAVPIAKIAKEISPIEGPSN